MLQLLPLLFDVAAPIQDRHWQAACSPGAPDRHTGRGADASQQRRLRPGPSRGRPAAVGGRHGRFARPVLQAGRQDVHQGDDGVLGVRPRRADADDVAGAHVERHQLDHVPGVRTLAVSLDPHVGLDATRRIRQPRRGPCVESSRERHADGRRRRRAVTVPTGRRARRAALASLEQHVLSGRHDTLDGE